jgi:hypothetical protein
MHQSNLLLYSHICEQQHALDNRIFHCVLLTVPSVHAAELLRHFSIFSLVNEVLLNQNGFTSAGNMYMYGKVQIYCQQKVSFVKYLKMRSESYYTFENLSTMNKVLGCSHQVCQLKSQYYQDC